MAKEERNRRYEREKRRLLGELERKLDEAEAGLKEARSFLAGEESGADEEPRTAPRTRTR